MLGPLRVESPSHDLVSLGSPRQKAVLAALLLESGFVVSVPRLLHTLWLDDPPATAVKNLQGYIHGLRRVLEGLPDVRLRTAGAGYVLDVALDAIDLHRFRQLVDAARTGEAEAANRLLDQALALWRGPALVDVNSAGLQPIAEQLEQERLSALEQQAHARVDSGRHVEALAILTKLVREHPLREDGRALLMLTQYRAGSPAEALATYREGRQILADELGVDPGEALERVHQQILQRDPSLAATAATPAATPHAIPGFSGRTAELAQLDALAATAPEPAEAPFGRVPGGSAATGDSSRIAVIDGLGGVGKTALAMQWAHRVQTVFPDGILRVDLRGFDPNQPPLGTNDALTELLHGLGHHGDTTSSVPQRTALWHKLMAGRRLVMILDDAASAEQVRPLLLGAGPHATLVTSRNSLAGLVATNAATHVGLGVLGTADAIALLAGALGQPAVSRQPEAAGVVARLCGYLPLALWVAAAHLAAHPGRDLRWLVQQLDADNRLAALEVIDDPRTSIRATLAISVDALAPPDQLMLRDLAALPGRDLTPDAAAALAGVGETVSAMTARLIDAHLVERRPNGRLAMHDLVRMYAAERGQLEDGDGWRVAARARLLEHYRATAASAGALLRLPRMLVPRLEPEGSAPAVDFTDADAAADWLETERTNLTAAIHAGVHDSPVGAWRLAVELRGFLRLRRYLDDWIATARDGLSAARVVDDHQALAACWHNLGHARWSAGEYAPAMECYAAALDASIRAGWPEGQLGSLSALGSVHHEMGQHDEAIDCYRRALALPYVDDFPHLKVITTGSLGLVYQVVGRLREALDNFTQLLDIAETQGSPDMIATSLGNIGLCQLQLGDLTEAERSLTRALQLYREVGSRNGEANVLGGVAMLCAETQRHDNAAYYAALALRIARDIGDRRIESDALAVSGVAAARRHDWTTAEVRLTEAVSVAEQTGYARGCPQPLVDLARVQLVLGDPRRALHTADDALRRARELRHVPTEADALIASASIRLTLGEYDASLKQALDAEGLAEQTGLRLHLARSLRVLGDVTNAIHGPGEASGLWARSREIAQAIGVPGLDTAS